MHQRREVEGAPNSVAAIVAEAVGRGIPAFQLTSAQDALIGLATVEHAQGRPENAEEILRQVVATRSRARGLAALNLGGALMLRGAYAEARRQFQQVVETGHPEYAPLAEAKLADLPNPA